MVIKTQTIGCIDYAPVTYIILFVIFGLLSRLGLTFSYFYICAFALSAAFIVWTFAKNRDVVPAIHSGPLLFVSLFTTLYVVIFYLATTGDELIEGVWSTSSLLVYLGALLIQIVLSLVSPKGISMGFRAIAGLSGILIFESIIFFLIPEYRFLISDFHSGFRFTSLFLNSYLMTGVFLIFGCLYMLQTLNSYPAKLLCLLLFSVAIIQTEDRSIFLCFALALSYFAVVRFFRVSSIFEKAVVTFAMPALLFALLILSEFLVDRADVFSIKSTLSRLLLGFRAYELVAWGWPFGTGPGSQVRLIFNNQVPTNILSYDFSFIGANLESKMLVEQRQFMAYFSERRNISTHNTYLDHFVSLGFWGVLVSVLFVCVQVHSFFGGLSRKSNNTFAFALVFSTIILFLFTSFINTIWLFSMAYMARRFNEPV